MTILDSEAVLNRLGYTPNEALLEQVERIEANTKEYSKIQKHMFDLHDQLKLESAHIAMSNSYDYFKIKIEAVEKERQDRAYELINAFANKYKVKLQKVKNRDTYYILGFDK